MSFGCRVESPGKTRYVLELCDISGRHAPVARFVSDTPFHAVRVGERFDDEGWERLDGSVRGSAADPVRYTVHSIKHLIVPNGGNPVVRYCLNLEPFHGPASPVWNESGH